MENLFQLQPEMDFWLEKMGEVSNYLWENGWAERNAGNLSVDVTEFVGDEADPPALWPTVRLDFCYPVLAGRFFLVTGSRRRFRDCAQNIPHNACILRLTEKGDGYHLVWGGLGSADFRPTSEFPSHLRIHEYLRQANASQRVVLHTHPTELVALSHLPDCREEKAFNRALWCVHPEVKFNLTRGIGLVPYTVPGSEALAQATVQVFRRGLILAVWQMHGCVAIGADIDEAYDLIEVVNKAARINLLCRTTGYIPEGLSREQLQELVRTFALEE